MFFCHAREGEHPVYSIMHQVSELSEIMSKVFDGIHNLDQNGVLGDPRPATAEAGNKYLEDIIEFLYRWVGMQDKA